MKKIIYLVFLVLILANCAGPRYTGTSIENIGHTEVVIIDDKETKIGFRQTMESWLKRNDYQYVVVPDGSKYDFDKINLEYVGYWAWDLALFLTRARISAFNKGQKIGEVEYKAPNSLNMNKYSNANERIEHMMDVLFSKISLGEANESLNKRESTDQDE